MGSSVKLVLLKRKHLTNEVFGGKNDIWKVEIWEKELGRKLTAAYSLNGKARKKAKDFLKKWGNLSESL